MKTTREVRQVWLAICWWFARHSPLLTRAHALRRVETGARMVARIWKIRLEDVEADLRRMREEVTPALQRLVAIKIESAGKPPLERMRVCAEIDPQFLREALAHGADQYVIKLLAERLAQMIERELRTVNLQRFTDPFYPPRTRA